MGQGLQSAGPNPFCEVGRTHPRDRHRMRPVDGHSAVWHCDRHDLFARVIEKTAAEGLERGDAIAKHDDGEGVVVRVGDERLGGVLVYYRA